jgi:hypothetical protein
VINFKEFAITLGVICRGDLHERLKFIYRLHLPPALQLSELEESNTPDDDRGVDSCSEVDEAEEVNESDGIERYNDGTIMDPLGAGVVVIQGKVTRQSSTDSERSRRSLEIHPSKSESSTSEKMAKPSEDFPTNSKDFAKVSDVVTDVSDFTTNVSDDHATNSEDMTNVSEVLTKVSEHSTKPSEGSACPSEVSSEIWDGSVESDSMGFDLVDMDCGTGGADTKSRQGIYRVVEGSDVTDGTNRNEVGQHSGVDGSSGGNMNQVSVRTEYFLCVSSNQL